MNSTEKPRGYALYEPKLRFVSDIHTRWYDGALESVFFGKETGWIR